MIIKVKKMSIFEYINRVLHGKLYLGYTVGLNAEVIELQIPFGKNHRDKTIIHEVGHLRINDNNIYPHMHKEYDRKTLHGILQFRWPKKFEIPEWSYTNELTLF